MWRPDHHPFPDGDFGHHGCPWMVVVTVLAFVLIAVALWQVWSARSSQPGSGRHIRVDQFLGHGQARRSLDERLARGESNPTTTNVDERS
jgi:uncharacterized membrane protein